VLGAKIGQKPTPKSAIASCAREAARILSPEKPIGRRGNLSVTAFN
jgi:hypothetical protein